MPDSTRTSARLLGSIRKAKEAGTEPVAEAADSGGATATATPRPASSRRTAAKKASPRRGSQTRRAPAVEPAAAAAPHRLSGVITPRPTPADADPYSCGGRVWPD